MKAGDFLRLVLLAAVWGGSYPFMRIAVPEFGPVALVEVRVVAAALCLLPIVIARGRLSELTSHAGPMLVNGIVNSALPFLLISYAMLYLSGGFGSIINSTTPFFAALVAYAWLGERLSAGRMLGLAIGFSGVVVLTWDSVSMSAASAERAFIAALAAALLYGVGVNYLRSRLSGVQPLSAAAGGQVAAATVLAPIALFHLPDHAPSAAAWAAAIALGLLSNGIAHVVYFRLVATAGAVAAVAVTFLIPVFAMLWGLVFMDEIVTAHMLAGATVILAGTALATGLVSRARVRRAV